jgi:hypothetical protein
MLHPCGNLRIATLHSHSKHFFHTIDNAQDTWNFIYAVTIDYGEVPDHSNALSSHEANVVAPIAAAPTDLPLLD